MAEATLKVNADISGLMSQLEEIKRKLEAMQTQGKQVTDAIDNGFKGATDSAKNYEDNINRLTRELKEQKQIIADMRATEQQLKVARRQSNDPNEIARYDKELKRLAQDIAVARREQVEMNSALEQEKTKLKEVVEAQKQKNIEGGRAQDIFKKLGNIMLATFSVGAITSFIKKSIELYDIQVQANTKLLTALKGRKDIYNDLSRQAIELQSKTRFGDEEILNVQAALAKVLGTNKTAIIELTPLVLDFATAQGMDLSTAAELVAKSVSSSTNSLKRYGIEIKGTKGSTERLKSAVEGLNRQVGGLAEAAANTGVGGFIQLKNAFSDFVETIGEAISSGGLIRFLNWAKELFEVKLSEKLEQERRELILLQTQINNTNIPQGERVKLIKKLKDIYPAYLSNIKEEKISNEELNKVLIRINNALLDKITLQVQNEKIEKYAKRAAELKIEILKDEAAITAQYIDIRKKLGKEIDLSLTTEQKISEIYLSLGKDWQSLRGFNQFIDVYRRNINQFNEANKKLNESMKFRDELAKQLGLTIDGLTKKEVEYTKALEKEKGKEEEGDEYLEKKLGAYEKLVEKLTENEKKLKDMFAEGKSSNVELQKQANIVNSLKNELQLLNYQIEAYSGNIDKLKPKQAKWEDYMALEKGYITEITDLYSNFSDNVIKAREAVNRQLDKDLNISLFDKLIKDMLFTDEQKKAISNSFSLFSEQISSFISISITRWNNIIDSIQDEISETEKRLEEEQKKQEEGLANNVRLEQQKLNFLKQKQKEAEEEQRAALERQRAIEAITQSINLATAISGILKQIGAKGPAGLIIAPALIATLLTLFKVSKQKAAEAAKFEEGGVGILGGRRHYEGGTYINGIGEAEKGELFAIVNRKQTLKFQSGIIPLIEGINRNDNSKLIKGLNEIALKANIEAMRGDRNINIKNTVSLNEVQDIKRIRELIENSTSVSFVDGWRIEKRGNITKRVKLN